VIDLMRGVVDSGTGQIIRQMGFNLPAAGKTGTTNQYKDAWFTGFTPSLATSVWIGYDRDKGLRDAKRVGITGGRGAAPIWADFMLKATAGESAREFSIPPNIRFERVDAVTGRKASYFTKETTEVALQDGQELKKIWQ
jgi:penicillin-binding protein 1A